MKTTENENHTKTSARKFLYYALLIILCVQLITLLNIHSLVGQLTICDTILLLLINVEESPFIGRWFQSNASALQAPFAHVVACVTVQALIFVTLTHSMEITFCDDSNAHLTDLFLAVTIISVSFKTSSMVYFRVELMNAAYQCILHLLAPAGVAILYTVNNFYSPAGNNYYLTRLDPLLSMLICIVITAIVLPLFFHHIPSMLCHAPAGIEIEKFKAEIEKNFRDTKCLHLHVFNAYPNDAFDVIMHVGIGVKAQLENLCENNNIINNEKSEEQKMQSIGNRSTMSSAAIASVPPMLSPSRSVQALASSITSTIQNDPLAKKRSASGSNPPVQSNQKPSLTTTSLSTIPAISIATFPLSSAISTQSPPTDSKAIVLFDEHAERVRIDNLIGELSAILHKAGAKRITIQPHYICIPHGAFMTHSVSAPSVIDHREEVVKTAHNPLWSACRTTSCSIFKGCCAA